MLNIKSRAVRYTLILAVIGVIVSSLITYVQRSTVRTYEQSLPFISLGDNIKNRTTKGHLWFEELMAGDDGNDIDRDVLSLFKSSREILEGAMNGSETELGKFEKSSDGEINILLKKGIDDLDLLIKATLDRWEFRKQSLSTVGVDSISKGEEAGGDLDSKFDATYERVQESMDQLVNHVNKTVTEDSIYFNTLSWISIFFTSVVFVILCQQLFRVQSRSDKLTDESKAQLEFETKRVTTMSSIIDAISAGNYNVDLGKADAQDNLTATLLTMRDRLKENAEIERQRNWATSGLAQIGDILRANSISATELYDNIIRFVVKYTKSTQGGLFLLHEEEGKPKTLDLMACYAYERKKFIKKKIEIGEGLVGQCFLEGEHILLLKVPEEYLVITSGLGGANPSALLLVPLKINGKIYGVLEIASFQNYNAYEIELAEKLGESIASTISTVRINESTRVLLATTQQQAEEMKSQEEEMRQNLEELSATQEEMGRKEKEYIDKINILEARLLSLN
jgi:GAF domain-containing protein